MKRWLGWILILLFMISGCSNQPDAPTDPTVATQTKNTEPARTIRWEGGALEEASAGSVNVYGISDSDINGMGFLGGDPVVLTSCEDGTLLTRFDARTGEIKVEKAVSGELHTGMGKGFSNVVMEGNRLAYYDAQENVVRILDASFKEISKVKLQQEPEGMPLIAADLSAAYFCVDNEIRALDLQTGIARMVCQRDNDNLTLQSLLLEDTVLCCIVTEEEGDSYVEFLNAENGLRIAIDRNLLTVESRGEAWLTSRLDGTTREVLVGDSDGMFRFDTADTACGELQLMSCGILERKVSYGNTTVNLYAKETGKRLNSLVLEGIEYAYTALEDAGGSYIWLPCRDSLTQQDILVRWDITASENGDDIHRITPRYTAENPDTDGLNALKQEAAQIGAKYGVQIHLDQDIPQTDGFIITYEYQVEAFRKALTELDRILARFPEGFLTTMSARNTDRQLHIGLIRSVQPEAVGGNPQSGGMYAFVDGSAWIILCAGDALELNFYHNLSHALDTYVYSNSIHYDFWSDCNPDGFQYDENYLHFDSHEGSPYLSGETRAFINAFSMTFPHEDRATVFAYAMMEDAGDYFESPYMQAKLKQLAMGIRQAFGWEEQEMDLVWEQYLREQ